MNEIITFASELLTEQNIPVQILTSPSDLVIEKLDLGLRRSLYAAAQKTEEEPFISEPGFLSGKTGYEITDCFRIHYLAVPLDSGGTVFFTGPFLPEGGYDTADINEICRTLHIPSSLSMWINQYYAHLPRLSQPTAHALLRMILIHLYGKAEIKALSAKNPETKAYRQEPVQNGNKVRTDERYEFENKLCEYIRNGDEKQAVSLINPQLPENINSFERRSGNTIRNGKNYAVILNTLFRKTVENTGVQPVFIDAVSREYAIRIENCESITELVRQTRLMVCAYCHLIHSYSSIGYSPLTARVISAVYTHQAEDLSLHTMAEKMKVSKTYLSSRFHKETGRSYSAYVTAIRMDTAARMLESTGPSIQEIAEACGYHDLAYFSRVFRKEKNLSPSAYRSRHNKTFGI